ncbi:MAG: hypothetical protein Q9227_005985 [Pyrenula ochraceoflavens]
MAPPSNSSLSTGTQIRDSHPSLHHSRSNLSSASQARRHVSRSNGPAITEPPPRRRRLTDHYTQPLRRHPWRSGPNRFWTASQLARERTEFFETRVSGRREIWEAIQGATELMRNGDLETAQAIVNAAGLILTTGDLVDGGYDSLGALYRIPEQVLQDPDDIVPEDDPRAQQIDPNAISEVEGKAPIDGETDAEEEDDALGKEGLETTVLVDKGKESERDSLKVKCRLSDRGGPDVVVMLGKSQNVGTLAGRVHAQAGVSTATQRIRIAYLGKILNEKKTLESQNWKEGHVVNAMVMARPAPGS